MISIFLKNSKIKNAQRWAGYKNFIISSIVSSAWAKIDFNVFGARVSLLAGITIRR